MKILSKRNNKALQSGNKLFVGYLPAGYPNLEEFKSIIKKCDTAGVDILEVGYPASFPFADGEIIKRANSLVDHKSVKTFHIGNKLEKQCKYQYGLWDILQT